ncbi:hypothetical protein TanjilG_21594 [Lupinus angustifolius]|uniref:Uncharacterized protein n=1 Tax=Lupinus angustifolius TaxID=3871 RepID=A0A394B8Y5_LUPAN|nr:PREDICTED: uncharacterized protein LOC109328920 [Lupinus angustifolius]XP_019418108.1 PREDICTED: uncharacterized protein LOC109328921 [Lupinus angustifolius]OIV95203.1 hypothetical protein TanjilG_21593 [Lupinus angustifolius]OIV95204.1 hypothetical protein TanjilG_21594 [Lupinus angustifolius]
MIHMEENKGGKVGVGEDNISEGMQCINHPHRNNNNPGGICAFCLQEKLGKLVSSSSSLSIHPSSSPSNSFRSNNAYSSFSATTYSINHSASIISSKATSTLAPTSFSSVEKSGTNHHHEHYMRSRLPFLLPRKNKNKKQYTNSSTSSDSAAATSDIIVKRSKSTATPRRRDKFLDDDGEEGNGDIGIEDFNSSQRKRNWFWSFLYLSSNPSSSSSKKFDAKSLRENINGSPRISAVNAASCTSREKCSLGASSLRRKSDMVVEEQEEEVDSVTSAASFERKVSRSRSVGCGSRSFSGDFFEKISTGFGDCTLRRVESQREGKTKIGAVVNRHNHYMKEKVMCGGLFGGFMINSSSNSSSSSTYWVSSSNDDGINSNYNNGESTNGRGSKSWGWAFSSPMRAFGTKTSSSKDNKKNASDKNVTPNLSAIPSLLTVSS